jgi:hypothetical protein
MFCHPIVVLTLATRKSVVNIMDKENTTPMSMGRSPSNSFSSVESEVTTASNPKKDGMSLAKARENREKLLANVARRDASTKLAKEDLKTLKLQKASPPGFKVLGGRTRRRRHSKKKTHKKRKHSRRR